MRLRHLPPLQHRQHPAARPLRGTVGGSELAARAGGRVMIDVDVFTPDEATGYLNRKLAMQGDAADQIAGLADDLGRLPLALAQAVAYITDRNLTVAAYRIRFADRKRRLTDLLPGDSHADGYYTGQSDAVGRATVATTWSLS